MLLFFHQRGFELYLKQKNILTVQPPTHNAQQGPGIPPDQIPAIATHTGSLMVWRKSRCLRWLFAPLNELPCSEQELVQYRSRKCLEAVGACVAPDLMRFSTRLDYAT